MIPSALVQASEDPALRGAPLAVYIWCLHNLDALEERPVKVAVVARILRMKETTAYEALTRLATCGYLARGHRPQRGARHYRLFAAPVKRHAA